MDRNYRIRLYGIYRSIKFDITRFIMDYYFYVRQHVLYGQSCPKRLAFSVRSTLLDLS